MSRDLTDEEIREWGARSRAAQGLPPKITDRALLRRLVTLAFTGLPEQPERPEKQADGDGRPPAGRARPRRRR
jgi:hypothetical protein